MPTPGPKVRTPGKFSAMNEPHYENYTATDIGGLFEYLIFDLF